MVYYYGKRKPFCIFGNLRALPGPLVTYLFTPTPHAASNIFHRFSLADKYLFVWITNSLLIKTCTIHYSLFCAYCLLVCFELKLCLLCDYIILLSDNFLLYLWLFWLCCTYISCIPGCYLFPALLWYALRLCWLCWYCFRHSISCLGYKY